MATWKEMLDHSVEYNNDKLIYCTLSDEELSREFSASFGLEEGQPFTAWGEQYVYFPIKYDGSEWVGSAPRNPCDISLEHQGGG